MNLLVTGGAGFIGSHLVEALLARVHRVTVVDDFNDFYDPAVKRRNVKSYREFVVETDIRNAASLRGVFEAHRLDAIIHLAAHLAARAGVRPSIAQPQP